MTSLPLSTDLAMKPITTELDDSSMVATLTIMYSGNNSYIGGLDFQQWTAVHDFGVAYGVPTVAESARKRLTFSLFSDAWNLLLLASKRKDTSFSHTALARFGHLATRNPRV